MQVQSSNGRSIAESWNKATYRLNIKQTEEQQHEPIKLGTANVHGEQDGNGSDTIFASCFAKKKKKVFFFLPSQTQTASA